MDVSNEKREKFVTKLRQEDYENKELLIKVQQVIKESGNNKEYISKIIKKLNKEQILELRKLYEKDIERLNTKINYNKRKMMSLKSEW